MAVRRETRNETIAGQLRARSGSCKMIMQNSEEKGCAGAKTDRRASERERERKREREYNIPRESSCHESSLGALLIISREAVSPHVYETALF